MTPEQHMHEAITLAIENVEAGRGGPFAALVVRDGITVAQGTNLVTSTHDPTAHAEVVAIRSACLALGDFSLQGCTLYTTCEPCPMCLGAIYWARLDHIYFACTRHDAAEAGFDDALIYHEIALPYDARTIPMEPLLTLEGQSTFQAWATKRDKIQY